VSNPKRRLSLTRGKRKAPSVTWSDASLVPACLRGDQQAWAALVDKYKHLIFSVPIRYGASREDAADIFQAVCLELFSELPRIRDIGALRSWLVKVAAHKYFRWKRRQLRQADAEASLEGSEIRIIPPADLEQFEEEQRIREAIAMLPERCQELIHHLFYAQPPLSYSQVAELLGVATGSIGFIRRRCLQRLQRILEEGEP
jgi:RNA polymerase sigma factor (sigma-70 family)